AVNPHKVIEVTSHLRRLIALAEYVVGNTAVVGYRQRGAADNLAGYWMEYRLHGAKSMVAAVGLNHHVAPARAVLVISLIAPVADISFQRHSGRQRLAGGYRAAKAGIVEGITVRQNLVHLERGDACLLHARAN